MQEKECAVTDLTAAEKADVGLVGGGHRLELALADDLGNAGLGDRLGHGEHGPLRDLGQG